MRPAGSKRLDSTAIKDEGGNVKAIALKHWIVLYLDINKTTLVPRSKGAPSVGYKAMNEEIGFEKRGGGRGGGARRKGEEEVE